MTISRLNASHRLTCAVLCSPQPPIALAPINCTQTAEPQTDEPPPKAEPHTTESSNQSGDAPERPPQETEPADDKNK